MSERIPSARLNALLDFIEPLVDAADMAAQAIARRRRLNRRVRRGATLRPGDDTPLWNEMAAELRRLCNRHGDKVNLGRYLGLPKQRVHEFLRARNAGPDAERTLMLLAWIAARRAVSRSEKIDPRPSASVAVKKSRNT